MIQQFTTHKYSIFQVHDQIAHNCVISRYRDTTKTMVDPPNVATDSRKYSSRHMPTQNQNNGSSRTSSEKQYKSKCVLENNITSIAVDTAAQTCALSPPSTRPIEHVLVPAPSAQSSSSTSTFAKQKRKGLSNFLVYYVFFKTLICNTLYEVLLTMFLLYTPKKRQSKVCI